MIALSHKTVLICFSDGNIEPLQLHDLVPHLLESLPKENGPLPSWMVERALESVIGHFRDQSRQTISLGEFLLTAKALLVSFIKETSGGYPSASLSKNSEIHHLPVSPCPPARKEALDLFKAARESGSGFELEFFKKVRDFLEQAGKTLPRTLETLEFTGLRRCAKYLAGRRRWSKRSAEVRDEIVSFIRKEMVQREEKKLISVIRS